ncbi:hypothetical protein ACVWXV_000514 [Thermostichus sp. OS-CIW-21]|jgi:hypothetical protein
MYQQLTVGKAIRPAGATESHSLRNPITSTEVQKALTQQGFWAF